MTENRTMNFYVPTRIFTGKGCVSAHAALFAEYGKKCLIVTGKHAADACGAFDDTASALVRAKVSFCRYDGITPNPTFASCAEAGARAASFGADFIVGIGGGSPLDAAKAAAVFAANPGLSPDAFYGGDWQNAPKPVFAVGTTAGTGSEVTPVSVITAPDGRKKSLRSPLIYPAAAFGDPTYTMCLPPEVTRATAVDALCHCAESYFNRTANELSRCFALRGAAILAHTLEKTVSDTALNDDDREALYNASLYGGLAISVTGTALPHAMGYFLSEQYAVPHGFACAVYLEEFLRRSAEQAPADAAAFFAALGVDRAALCETVRRTFPEKLFAIRLSDKEIEALLPRFEHNKSIEKSLFVPEDGGAAILRGLFS